MREVEDSVSYQAVRWALYDAPHLYTDTGLPDTTARSVLVVLAEHADEHGTNAHPSPLRIRFATGYDVRTIQRALDRLEAGQLIAADGVVYSGTPRWKLSMSLTRPEGEWEGLQAEADQIRREESAKRRARRDRQASIADEAVRDAESRMSGTEDAGLRDAESRMSGTQRHPNHQEEPPLEPPLRTTPGGRPAPRPPRTRRPFGPSDRKELLAREPRPTPRPTG